MSSPTPIAIDWTTSLKRKLTPWHGSPNKPKSLRRPKLTGPAVFRGAFDHTCNAPILGWTDAALVIKAQGDALTGDAPLSAVYEALFLRRGNSDPKAYTLALFAAHDASFALDVLAQVRPVAAALSSSSHGATSWSSYHDTFQMLGHIRRQLAGTKQPEYDAATQRAQELWDEREDELALRLQLAYLFPDQPQWGDAVARAWPERHTEEGDRIPTYVTAGGLVYGTGASTSCLLELNSKLFAPGLEQEPQGSDFGTTGSAWDVFYDAVDIRGEDAVAALVDFYERAPVHIMCLAEALCLIPHADVARAFSEDIARRGGWYRPMIDMCVAYLYTNPTLSLGPLERTLGQATYNKERLEPLLEGVRVQCDLIQKEEEQAELFVPREALPRGLANPPWRDTSIKRKRRKKYDPEAFADLEMIPHETRHTLGEGDLEHDANAKEARGKEPEARVFTSLMGKIREAGRVNWEHARGAEQLSRARCLELLEGLSADVLVNTSASWTIYEMCVETIGAESLPFIERRATSIDADAYDSALLDHVGSPHLVKHVAYGLGRAARRRHALSWIQKYPRAAAVGAIPGLLRAPDAKSRNGFIDALCAANVYHPDVVREVVGEYGDEVASALPELDVYLQCPARMPKLPDFWAPERWASIVLEEDPTRLLPREVYEDIGFMLEFSPLGVPYVGLRELGEVADETSLAQFSWDLFTAWVDAGAANKDFWVVQALSLFGGAQMADSLAQYIDRWNDSQFKTRSEKALASLENDENPHVIETLWRVHVGGFSQLSRYSYAQDRARSITGLDLDIEPITDARAPTFGMDQTRRLSLVEGSDLEVWFDADLEPHLRTADKDAAQLDPTTQLRWDRLQGLCARQSRFQALRFERAMKTRRRWIPETWRADILEHPLLGLLARGLVWGSYEREGSYDTEGRLVGTWRIDEAFDVVDLQDDVALIDDAHVIGVVHPVELSADDLGAWSQILSDYELAQPFTQLGRDVVDATGEQLDALLADLEGKTTTLGAIQRLRYLDHWQSKPNRKRETPVTYLERTLSGERNGREFGVSVTFSPGFESGYRPIQKMSEPMRLGVGGTVKKLKRHTWEKISAFDRAELHHELSLLIASSSG